MLKTVTLSASLLKTSIIHFGYLVFAGNQLGTNIPFLPFINIAFDCAVQLYQTHYL